MDSQTFLTYTCRIIEGNPAGNTCIYLDRLIISTAFAGPPPMTVAGGAMIHYTTCAGIQEHLTIQGMEGVFDPNTGAYITEMSVQTCIIQDSLVGPTPEDPADGWVYTVLPEYLPEISCNPSQCISYRVTLPTNIFEYSVEYINCSGNLVRVPLGQVTADDNMDETYTYSVCVKNNTAIPVFIQNNQAVEIGYNWQAEGPCSF